MQISDVGVIVGSRTMPIEQLLYLRTTAIWNNFRLRQLLTGKLPTRTTVNQTTANLDYSEFD